jgi:transcriptional regulator with XRE-family HTH domain
MASAKSVSEVDGSVVRFGIGDLLRRSREARSRTLTEVAAEAGCSPAYLSEVERGLKDVSSDLLVAIAHALSLSIGSLFLDLGESLEPDAAETWPRDPRRQLRLATATLPPDALRTVAQFSAFLASPAKPARRIGFAPSGEKQ